MSFWKKLLKKEDKALTELEKETLRVYRDLNKELKVILSDANTNHKMFKDWGDDERAVTELMRSNRYKNLMDQVNTEVNKIKGKKDGLLKRGLSNLFNLSFTNVMKSADNALKPSVSYEQIKLNTDVVEIALLNSLSGLSFEELNTQYEMLLKNEIKRELTQGLILNEGYEDIAKRLKKRVNIDANRALRIARTEGTRVQSEARLRGIERLEEDGINVYKEWVSARDLRTRDAHRKLNGQKVPLDEKFSINGYEARAPGQFPIASLNVNCRCSVVTYFPEEE